MMPDAVADRIEPDAKAMTTADWLDPDRQIAANGQLFLSSIAISMRRIADAVTYQAVGGYNLFDHIRAMAEKP